MRPVSAEVGWTQVSAKAARNLGHRRSARAGDVKSYFQGTYDLAQLGIYRFAWADFLRAISTAKPISA